MEGAPLEPPLTVLEDGAIAETAQGTRPGLKVVLDLGSILEHCKCSICMGIVKNTRAVSACMHRFCKDCIEAWLRTQIENNCPQCRVKFSSKRDCKPDPNFDLLLGAMFGDIRDFEQRMLDPSVEVLEAAKAVGHQIAMAKEQAAWGRRPSPPPLLPQAASALRLEDMQPQQQEQVMQQQQQQPIQQPVQQQQQPVLQQARQQAADAVVHVTVARGRGHGASTGSKRGAPGAGGEGKRLKLNLGGDDDDGSMQYRGVRFQGDNWQARTKRSGKELSLGLYNTAEEAGMAYDLDRLQQQGGKAQRLNFPLLRQHYKQILADLADLATPDGLLDFLAVAVQAALKAARAVPGATAPENTGPAAASVLNPRRSIAPAVHVAEGSNGRLAATGAGAAAAAAAGGDSDYDEPPVRFAVAAAAAAAVPVVVARPAPPPAAPQSEVALMDQHTLAAQRAEQLAVERPLEAGLAGGVAHVRLESGSGLAWRMTYLACPAGATVAQLSEAVAVGLSQQHGLGAGALAVGLAVANDLDASADFDALCYEDAATGNLLLRGHVTIRDLLGTLQDPLEDLALEYHSSSSGGAAAGAAQDGLAAMAAAVTATA